MACTKTKTPFTQQQQEIIDGLMLGDGGLRIRKRRGKTPNLSVATIHKTFAEHLQLVFPLLKSYFRPGRAGVIRDRPFQSKGIFQLETCCDLSLLPFYNRWYPNGIKIIPSDVMITPLSLKYWFYGDGSSRYNERPTYRHVEIHFSTYCFTKDDCNMLCNKLQKALQQPLRVDKRRAIISSRGDTVNAFFDFIGPCDVPCFDYKWKRPATVV